MPSEQSVPPGASTVWQARGPTMPARIRIGRDLPDDRADAQTIALSRAAAARIEHVERLVDLGATASGDVVIDVEAAPRGLGELLAAPGEPTPGEAVTLLAPLLGAMLRLHDLGVTHGSIDADAVRFDASGAPALVGFRSAVLADRVDTTGFAAACAADGRALGLLAAGVLRRAGIPVERVDAITVGWLDHAAVDAAIDALFDLADPEPIRFDRVARIDPLPMRLIEPRAPAPGQTLNTGLPVRGRPTPARVLAMARTVRKRVWVAAGSGLASLVAALVLASGGR